MGITYLVVLTGYTRPSSTAAVAGRVGQGKPSLPYRAVLQRDSGRSLCEGNHRSQQRVADQQTRLSGAFQALPEGLQDVSEPQGKFKPSRAADTELVWSLSGKGWFVV